MRPLRVLLVLVIVALGAKGLDAQSPVAAPLERLRLQIEAAIKPAQGDVGVAIRHLESGAEVSVRADEPFPMASAFKLPILV